MPSEWYEASWPDPEARLRHLHSQGIDMLPAGIEHFDNFYEKRKAVLVNKI